MILLIFLMWMQTTGDCNYEPIDLFEEEVIVFNDYDACFADYYCNCPECEAEEMKIDIYNQHEWDLMKQEEDFK